jgi:hypothetical protein
MTHNKLRSFAERIARMTDESETHGGFSWEDASATLNALIGEARELTGVDPGHPRLYCMACGLNAGDCECGGNDG